MKTLNVSGHTVMVDDEDYLDCLIWGLYVNVSDGYAHVKCVGGKHRSKGLARVLMKEPAGIKVDHKDGNTLNNCKGNLRLATDSQSMHNRTNWGESKFKGVYRNGNGWATSIYLNGKKKYLGTFTTQEAAAAVYRKAAEEIQGEFAFHNSRGAGDNS